MRLTNIKLSINISPKLYRKITMSSRESKFDASHVTNRTKNRIFAIIL